MSQTLFHNRSATKRALDVPALAPRPKRSEDSARVELELKIAELQKDYADLHAAIFEAAQVHRRLCAPRLVRCGDFEIASEIFAVRHLPGDFFTMDLKRKSAFTPALSPRRGRKFWRVLGFILTILLSK